MNDEPRDKSLEEAYRDASQETPPPELDARILAAAHRAVQARPQDAARRPGWVGRYRIPLSVAATALIAVTLAFMVEDETQRAPEPDAPVAAPRQDAPWGSRSATPAQPPRKLEAPASAPPPAQTVPPPATAPAEAQGAAPAMDAARAERASAPEPSKPMAMERQGVPAADANVRAAPPAAASAPAPAAPAATGIESRERAAQERPSRLTRDEAVSAGARSAGKVAAPAKTPEAWLEDIRRLRAEGRLTEADEALAAFQRAYPDYVLPADLARP